MFPSPHFVAGRLSVVAYVLIAGAPILAACGGSSGPSDSVADVYSDAVTTQLGTPDTASTSLAAPTATTVAPSTTGPVTSTSAPETVARTATSSVDLLDTGVEPRFPLAIDVEVGDTWDGTVSLLVEFDQTIDGAPAPPLVTPLTEAEFSARVTAVRPDAIDVALTYDEWRAIDPGGVDPAQLTATQAALEPLSGATGTSSITPFGEVITTVFEAPAGVDGSAGAEIAGEAPASAPPFPDVPVGIGARWTVRTTAGQSGKADQVETYELIAWDGVDYELNVTIEQTYADQSFAIDGGEARILPSSSGTGSGTIVGEISTLGPSSTTSNIVAAQQMKLTIDGVTHDVDQVVTVTNAVEAS